MPVISSLKAILSLDSAQFTSGAKQAVSSLNTLKNLALGFAGFEGIRAAADTIRGVVESGSQLGVTAEKIGITTEQLANLQRVAQLVGTDVESLTSGISKMNKNIVEGARADGSKEFAEALAAINLQASKLRSLSVNDAFLKIADAIKKVPDPMLRSEAAMKIFGKGGADLLPILLEGSKAIEAQAKHTEALGIALSGIQSAKLEVVRRNFLDLKNAAMGIAEQFAIAIAPAISYVTGKLVAFFEKFKIGQNVGKALAAVFSGIGDAIDYIHTGVLSLSADFLEMGANINDALSWFSGGPKSTETRKNIDAIRKRIFDIDVGNELGLGGQLRKFTNAALAGPNDDASEIARKRSELINGRAPSATLRGRAAEILQAQLGLAQSRLGIAEGRKAVPFDQGQHSVLKQFQATQNLGGTMETLTKAIERLTERLGLNPARGGMGE